MILNFDSCKSFALKHPITFLLLAVLLGFFEIQSLSGSSFLSEINGQHHRTGGLRVALARSAGGF